MPENPPAHGGIWRRSRDPAAWERAVAIVRGKISPEDRKAFREALEEDPWAFVGAHHFSTGLTVRNLLRTHGFAHEALGAMHPDDTWVEVLQAAVAEDESGEDEPRP